MNARTNNKLKPHMVLGWKLTGDTLVAGERLPNTSTGTTLLPNIQHNTENN